MIGPGSLAAGPTVSSRPDMRHPAAQARAQGFQRTGRSTATAARTHRPGAACAPGPTQGHRVRSSLIRQHGGHRGVDLARRAGVLLADRDAHPADPPAGVEHVPSQHRPAVVAQVPGYDRLMEAKRSSAS
jgi:hypothetical protein